MKQLKNRLFLCLIIAITMINTVWGMEQYGNIYNAIVEQLRSDEKAKIVKIDQLSKELAAEYARSISDAESITNKTNIYKLFTHTLQKQAGQATEAVVDAS